MENLMSESLEIIFTSPYWDRELNEVINITIGVIILVVLGIAIIRNRSD